MGTSGSHNPTLTAQALAWRTAEYLVKNWVQWSVDSRRDRLTTLTSLAAECPFRKHPALGPSPSCRADRSSARNRPRSCRAAGTQCRRLRELVPFPLFQMPDSMRCSCEAWQVLCKRGTISCAVLAAGSAHVRSFDSACAIVTALCGCVRFIHDACGRRAGPGHSSASARDGRRPMASSEDWHGEQPSRARTWHLLPFGEIPFSRHAAGPLPDGRGARNFRPRGALSRARRGELRYGFDAPIPYGSGDAFTRFNGAFPISPLADLTASASGMEAQHSLADAIAERAVARGRLHYREGWLYFESRMTTVSYILSASPHSSEGR